MMEYIPCYDPPAEHWGLLPATRLASRKILIEQNIKRQTGPALCVFCLLGPYPDLGVAMFVWGEAHQLLVHPPEQEEVYWSKAW
jgi:hypothetical protein